MDGRDLAEDMLTLDPDSSEAETLDAETGAQSHKHELRLWLRLLTCTTMTETLIRGRLRERFGVTLPRFDLLAQLARAAEGMTLGDLSRRMMVTNGNVTGLVERLVADGLVARTPRPSDRRTVSVALTEAGRREFAQMAAEHEGWVADAFGGLSEDDIGRLMQLLARLKESVGEGGRALVIPAPIKAPQPADCG
jgi:DNA-binding MarR family transcriptional regulator